MASVDQMNQELNQAATETKQAGTQVTNDIANLPTEIQEQLQAKLNKAKRALTEVNGSVSADQATSLCMTYQWATLGLVAALIGFQIGKSVVGAILESIIEGYSGTVALLVLEPAVVWGGYKMLKDRDGKEVLLGASAALGAVIGVIISERRMEFTAPQPYVLTLLLAGTAYGANALANSAPIIFSDRKYFLPFMFLPAITAFYLISPVEGSSTFLFYALILEVIAFIDVQVKLDGSQGQAFDQWTSVVVLGIADQVAFTMLSSSG